MSRSLKKGPFVQDALLKKAQQAKAANSNDAIKTWSRSSTIIPEMVGLKFAVHNGKDFITVLVVENMVGHKLGEFASTRKFNRHGGKIQKEQEAAAAEAAKKSTQAAAPTKK